MTPGRGDDGGAAYSVEVEDEQDVPLDAGEIRARASAMLGVMGVPAGAALGITLVDSDRMAELKLEALGVNSPTDVLSFPMDFVDDPMPGPLVLGDIVVCPAVAARQAAGLGRALTDEIAHLLAHGILHVLGRDHDDPRSERAMFAEEQRILSAVTMESHR